MLTFELTNLEEDGLRNFLLFTNPFSRLGNTAKEYFNENLLLLKFNSFNDSHPVKNHDGESIQQFLILDVSTNNKSINGIDTSDTGSE